MAHLSRQEQEQFKKLAGAYLSDPRVRSMQRYVQHGRVSTLEHSLKVARLCFWMSRRLPIKADEERLIPAALLHDFYLYDWHESGPGHEWHGFRHPLRAAENARRYFHLGDAEQKIIESHMWPLTITRLPVSREAWMLCVADKCCALSETIFGRSR